MLEETQVQEYSAHALPPNAPTPGNGQTMRAVALEVASERESLKASGLLKPATIVNFNPIELVVECPLIRYHIPAAGKGKNVVVPFQGRKLLGSWVTIRDAIVRPKIKQVSKSESADEPTQEYGTFSVLPIEQAWIFWNEYTAGDSPVGGLLCFEGDVHTLKKPGELLVPTFLPLPNRTRKYFGQPRAWEAVLTEISNLQRLHCTARLDRAQGIYNDPDQRKNLSNTDHEWAGFAKQQGWIQTDPEWIFAKHEDTDVCTGCGAVKKHPTARFCVCGRPYDAFSAFLAGENVPMAYLVTLPEDKLKQVKKEIARRRELEADLTSSK